MARTYSLTLPWPPSVNRYWRVPKGVGRPILSEEGRTYRERVRGVLLQLALPKLDGQLRCRIVAVPPDRRRHDVDNLLKATLDSLQHGGLYDDDYQIQSLSIERTGHDAKNNGLLIEIGPAA